MVGWFLKVTPHKESRMFFQLKIRNSFEEEFQSTEDLFEFLWNEQVIFELYDDIKQHQFAGQMTCLGIVKYVGRNFKFEKALYVNHFTPTEFEALKMELEEIARELSEKWKNVPA